MRKSSSLPLPASASGQRHDWTTIKSLLPYLWQWKWRVLLALSCLIAAKLANVAVPIIFKHIVDDLGMAEANKLVLVPLGLEKAGADPAVASSVFVTMVTDSMGFLVFLGLATAAGLTG